MHISVSDYPILINKERIMIVRKYITAFFVLTALVLHDKVKAQSPVLTLAECRRLALEQNKKMKAAQYRIDASKAALKAANANAYPSIDASLLGIYLGKPIGGAFDGMIPDAVASGTVTASQAIYAGGKIRTGKEAAGKGVEIQEEQKLLTASEVLLNVEKAYWQIVQVNEKIILANKYRDMLQALQQDLQNSFDAGMIYKNDLLRVEVNLNEAKLNIIKAQDGLVMAKLNLAQIIGNANNTTFELADSVTGNFSEVQAGSLAEAAEKRPEIRLLKKSVEAEELQRKLLKADRLPTIGLSASGLATAGKGANFTNGKDFLGSWYGLASISVPIFDWGKRNAKVREQSFKIAAQQQQLDETKEMIGLEVQQAYLLLNQSVKNIELSQLSLQQADENLKLANDRFKAGTITGKDVQEAQAIWQQAYSGVIDAKVAYKVNEAAYKKAMGSL
ncbi:MAG TPA: TolC family protein [Chitinophaga sp.]|nr:TolC family protein [Chitinophaga sp.]